MNGDYITKADLRRVFNAMADNYNRIGSRFTDDVRDALRALDAPQEPCNSFDARVLCSNCHDPYTEHGKQQQPLPVPGEGDCPEWARWIAWSKYRTSRGDAYWCRDEPWKDGGDLIGSETKCCPNYDDPARAGTCVALMPRERPAIEADGGCRYCDARSGERPANPLPEVPPVEIAIPFGKLSQSHVAMSYYDDAVNEANRQHRFALALRDRCERAETRARQAEYGEQDAEATANENVRLREKAERELASLQTDIASLAHPVCKRLLEDKAQAERERDEARALYSRALEVKRGRAGGNDRRPPHVVYWDLVDALEDDIQEARALAWEQAGLSAYWRAGYEHWFRWAHKLDGELSAARDALRDARADERERAEAIAMEYAARQRFAAKKWPAGLGGSNDCLRMAEAAVAVGESIRHGSIDAAKAARELPDTVK